MSDYPHYFELGGVAIPIQANTRFTQSMETLSGETWPPIRTVDGTGIKQTAWTGKLRATLSGEGWIPPGLKGLDFSQAMTLKTGEPVGITSASNVVTLPTARRSDAGFTPYGAAIVGGQAVDSDVSLLGDDLTITTVSGATGYVAYYYPELTVWAQAPQESGNLTDGTYSWSLQVEEQ